MQPLESYNLFAPETAENPFEYYAALRSQAPVYKMPIGMWIVSTHALCLEAIRVELVRASEEGTDILLVAGGSSVGREDHLPTLVREVGEGAFEAQRVVVVAKLGHGPGKSRLYRRKGNSSLRLSLSRNFSCSLMLRIGLCTPTGRGQN